jgi:ribosomal protein S3
VTDNKFSFSTEADGYYVDVKGKVEGDELSAEVAVEGDLPGDGRQERIKSEWAVSPA